MTVSVGCGGGSYGIQEAARALSLLVTCPVDFPRCKAGGIQCLFSLKVLQVIVSGHAGGHPCVQH